MLAAARSVPSSAESYAFRAQKRAQAAKRAEEKRIVQETHLNLSSKTMSVKNLRVSAPKITKSPSQYHFDRFHSSAWTRHPPYHCTSTVRTWEHDHPQQRKRTTYETSLTEANHV
jgi:Tfp pilus assembly protein PilX